MRLFYGLSLPPRVRGHVRDYALLAAGAIPGRYALPENYHMTLAFLGEVPDERIREAADVLVRCACAFPAPRVTLTSPSHFGREQNAILILRGESEPNLAPLHEALVRALRAQGLPFDPGPFSPHVTLARHARLAESRPPAFSPIVFTADRACLFLSARDAENVLRYTPLSEAVFQKNGI